GIEVIRALSGEVFIVLSPETFLLGFQRAHDLVEACDVVTANTHGFTNRLRGGGQGVISADKLFKGKAWSLDDDIVEGWFKSRRCYTGDVIGDFVQGVSDSQLCS